MVLAGAAMLLVPATAPAEPLGDTRVSDTGAGSGRAFACPAPRAIPFAASRPWIAGASYSPQRRPVVDGRVRWPVAPLSLLRRPFRT